jgi:hypothetical protein
MAWDEEADLDKLAEIKRKIAKKKQQVTEREDRNLLLRHKTQESVFKIRAINLDRTLNKSLDENSDPSQKPL